MKYFHFRIVERIWNLWICVHIQVFIDGRLTSWNFNWFVCIDEHVRLVRLIRLQTENFRLFLRQHTDKRQTYVCTISKRSIN